MTVTDSDARPPTRSGVDAVADTFLRDGTALAALAGVAARVDALVTSLEARPCTEGPLEALAAVIDSDEGQVLTVGPDEELALGLIRTSPSLAGRVLWKAEAVIDRLARDFGRREGLRHTDLRPQLLAAGVAAALNAALRSWSPSPPGPSVDELTRRALAQLADGLGEESPRQS
jgi:hypothetical protein